MVGRGERPDASGPPGSFELASSRKGILVFVNLRATVVALLHVVRPTISRRARLVRVSPFVAMAVLIGIAVAAVGCGDSTESGGSTGRPKDVRAGGVSVRLPAGWVESDLTSDERASGVVVSARRSPGDGHTVVGIIPLGGKHLRDPEAVVRAFRVAAEHDGTRINVSATTPIAHRQGSSFHLYFGLETVTGARSTGEGYVVDYPDGAVMVVFESDSNGLVPADRDLVLRTLAYRDPSGHAVVAVPRQPPATTDVPATAAVVPAVKAAAPVRRTVSCGSLADAPRGLSAGTACWTVTVPVARGVADAKDLGTIRLALAEKRRGRPRGGTAILALAGGPGQSALPFLSDVASELRSVHLPLIVLDQRGTGASGVVDCRGIGSSRIQFSRASGCANHLGDRAGWYRTDDSVEDIEAVRQALGYSKLIVYGVSYGTYVAQRYAAAHPTRVAKLILDSPLPANLVPHSTTTYAAIRRILPRLCTRAVSCASPAAFADDTKLVLSNLRRKPALARTVDSAGRKHRLQISETDVLDVLYAGDTDYRERSWFPAAIRGASVGDLRLLARLVEIDRAAAESTDGRTPLATGSAARLGRFSRGLNLATTCADARLDWPASVEDLHTRLDAEDVVLEGLAADRAFEPFGWQDVSSTGDDADSCSVWPAQAIPRPTVVTSLPQVPTLVLVGDDDIRTPLENLPAILELLPKAKVIRVPHQGHDVSSSPCTLGRAAAWLLGRTARCRATPKILAQALAPLPISLRQFAGGGAPSPTRLAQALIYTLRVASDDAYNTAYGSLVSGTAGLHVYHAGGAARGCPAQRAYGLVLTDYAALDGLRVSGRQNLQLGRLGACSAYFSEPTIYHLKTKTTSADITVSRFVGSTVLTGTVMGQSIRITVSTRAQAGGRSPGDIVNRQADAASTYYHSR